MLAFTLTQAIGHHTRLASSSRALGHRPPVLRINRSRQLRNSSRTLQTKMAAAAEAPPLGEGMWLFTKAGPDGSSLGDCPFTMKANLALRLKRADFKIHSVDLGNKPAWFLDLNEEGTTPVFVDGTYAICDSDEIVEYADKTGPAKDVVLIREDDPLWDGAFDAVSPLFGALVRLLKNKEPSEDANLQKALDDALRGLDKFLGSGSGPFLLGEQICGLDCNLAPKLHHTMVAAAHYKGFKMPVECINVVAYMDRMRATEEWKAASFPDEAILWGWGKFFS